MCLEENRYLYIYIYVYIYIYIYIYTNNYFLVDTTKKIVICIYIYIYIYTCIYIYTKTTLATRLAKGKKVASMYLSEDTLKAVGLFFLVSMPGEVKDPTQGVTVACHGNTEWWSLSVWFECTWLNNTLVALHTEGNIGGNGGG